MRTCLALSVLVLAACGGSSTSASRATDPSATSGGDVTSPTTTTPPAPTFPGATPIPVPQPAIARDALSPTLQEVWQLVENAVEIRPPDPPTEATEGAITAWASGPFHDWITRRGDAVHAVEEAGAPLQSATGAERGVAAALFGYLYEETAAGAHGAPVPANIAADPDLLHAYEQALLESLAQYAHASTESYASCAHTFGTLHDPAWNEWGVYCVDRGSEVIEIYHLEPQ